MSIGDQIRDARNRMGISQEELALLIHVSRGKVSHWETGLTLEQYSAEYWFSISRNYFCCIASADAFL